MTVSDGNLSDSDVTSSVNGGVGLHGEVLYIIGTDGKDVVHVNATHGERLNVHANFDVGRRHHGRCDEDMDDADWSDDDDRDSHRGAVRYHFNLSDVTRIEMSLCDGDDTITGNQGRDLLIGGIGADKLTGNADEDVLISGDTSYDGNPAALLAIMAEWSSNKTYAVRVSNLLNGTGLTNGYQLNGNDRATQTDFADADIDVLTGSQGTDVFWANLVADNGGAIDVLMDKANNETATDSDL